MDKDFVIVLAPDSFKESMTAKEACEAMERGIKRVNNQITCIQVPMADGGEGTMQSLVDATGGEIYMVRVIGPLGNEVEAPYGILGDGQTGIIEMASASGLHLVRKEDRNPLITTTYGTGQLIKACLDQGINKLLIGIGGSATNDGGAGVIQALGGKLLDENGEELGFGGGELGRLARIDLTNFDPRIKDITVEVACDVNNPLCGERGAAVVFGPQKGATPEVVERLDKNFMNYANVIKAELNIDIVDVPGAGAAGGLGAGLMVFLNGTLKKGIDIVIEYTSLEDRVKNADMVWTGEGSIDFQTKFGKTPYGVASVAKKYNKPVVAFTGSLGESIDSLYEKIDSIFSIMQGVTSLEEALVNGQQNLQRTSENAVKLMNLMR
ncbi:glycerate kinase [Neobacillus drentensis]|uniref:glycerate kinase family protein n=1 Tax=Neobacillus drentensis TaxID=220684 RepID=UPI003000E066